MIKMKIQDRLNEENCRLASDLLRERSYLSIYPDPFEPARGPANDLRPIEDEIQIRSLSLAKNEITDISPLVNFKDLTQLNINFNPISEITTNSYTTVTSVLPVVDTDDYSGAEIVIGGKHLIVFQSNKIFDAKKIHQLTIKGMFYSWEGPFAVYLDNKKL